MQSPLAIYCLTHGKRSSIHPESAAEQTRKRKARRRAESMRRMLQAIEGASQGLQSRALKRSPSYEDTSDTCPFGHVDESGDDADDMNRLDADWRDWGIYPDAETSEVDGVDKGAEESDMTTRPSVEMYCMPIHIAEEIKRTLTGAYCEGNLLLANLESTHVPTILNSNPCYRTLYSITEATRRAVNNLVSEGSVRAVLSNK